MQSAHLLRILAALAISTLALPAQACMFVRDIPPEAWYQWSASLFAGEVTKVEEDVAKAIDTIDVRVTETFKGPSGESATLTMPVRLRKLCKLELPKPGDRILVALNERNDSSWVPLSEGYSQRMREQKKP
ncbi:MAG TPA: hypothetical protein VE935_14875 [Burkholderiales bacterium]|jgi:hypothetical protein|nr:hypothetical protein [Burkholderiales bacterium]